MAWAETERQSLVQTLRTTDPDGATLCTGWDARHVLAHLVQREQMPASSIGDVIDKQLAKRPPGEEKYLGRLVEGAASPTGYEALVRRFAAGPPRWSPMKWGAERISLLEYVIHHEDIRRGSTPVPARELPAEMADAVWTKLPAMVRLSYRGCPVGVTLARPGGAVQVVKTGTGSVVLTGEPVELALYVTGRRAAASVQVSGTPGDVAAFESWASKR